MLGKEQNVLLARLTLLQHIHMGRQLPHLLLICGSSNPHQAQNLTEIHSQLLKHKITHHITKCPKPNSIDRSLSKFINAIREQNGGRQAEGCTCYVAVCGGAGDWPGIRAAVGRALRGGLRVEVLYLLVAEEGVKGVQLQMDGLKKPDCKNRARILQSCGSHIKYQLQPTGKIKQTICLILTLNTTASITQIISWLEQTLPLQLNYLKTLTPAPAEIICLDSLNANSIKKLELSAKTIHEILNSRPNEQWTQAETAKTYRIGLVCFVQILKCFLDNSHQAVRDLEGNLGERERDFMERIDWVLGEEVIGVVRDLMVASAGMEVLGYLKVVVWALDSYRQARSIDMNMMEQQQHTVYYQIPKNHLQTLSLQPGKLLITTSWTLPTTQEPIATDNHILLSLTLPQTQTQGNKHIFKYKENWVVWPYSVFEVEEVEGLGVRATLLGHVDQQGVRERMEEVCGWGELGERKAEQREIVRWGNMVKKYLPGLADDAAIVGKIPFPKLQAKIFQNYFKLSQPSKQQCITALHSIAKLHFDKMEYVQSLSYYRILHSLLTSQQQPLLASLRDPAIAGHKTSMKKLQTYTAICLELAEVYNKLGMPHKGLEILQQCLFHFPIFSNLEQSIAEMEQQASQASLNELHLCYISSLIKCDMLDLATKWKGKVDRVFYECRGNRELNEKVMLVDSQRFRAQQCLEQQSRCYNKILSRYPTPTQKSLQIKLKLAECKTKQNKHDHATKLIQQCIAESQSASRPALFLIECKLLKIACLKLQAAYDACEDLYEEIIGDMDGLVKDMEREADIDYFLDAGFLGLFRTVYVGYWRMLAGWGRMAAAMEVYQEYLERAPEGEIVDPLIFIAP